MKQSIFTKIRLKQTGVIGLFVTFLLALGCTSTVPKRELAAYTQAFDEAEVATEQLILYLDRAKLIASEVEKRSSNASTPFQLEIQLRVVPYSTPKIDVIAARRLALDVIVRYNSVLMALAEGKKPEEIRSSISSLTKGLSTFAGIASNVSLPLNATTSLISTIVSKLQDAHNKAQFEAAIREASPIIDKILDLFRKDAEDVYRISAENAYQRITGYKDSIFDLSIQMNLVAMEHEEPELEFLTEFRRIKADLRNTLDTVGFNDMAIDLPTTGQIPFDDNTLNQLRSSLDLAETMRDQYSAVVTEQNALYGLIESYGYLLLKTSQSLKTLGMALDRPAEFSSQASELIMVVFQVKRDIDAYTRARIAADDGKQGG